MSDPRPLISGIGISSIGRRTGRSALELTTEAATKAIADAGLTASEIDGVSTMGETPADEAAAALDIEMGFEGGGAGGAWGGLFSPIFAAADAVVAGRARHVLVYRTVRMLGGTVMQAAGTSDAPTEPTPPRPPTPHTVDLDHLVAANALSAANWAALTCRRHMHLYGTTKEQLGWVAVNSRANAALNPDAIYREPLTMDDYLAAPAISSPLGRLDCDVPVDGSIALVVSTPGFAADCPNPAVRIDAAGGASGVGGWTQRPDFPVMAMSDAAAQMWSRTDLKVGDLDVAELYDGFTFFVLGWLEALGVCPRGESGPFVDGGHRIALHGDVPVNTYGGQLSAGRLHGYWTVHEACLQLRGQAAGRQAGAPEVAVATNGGGPYAGCVLLTT